MKPKKSCCFLVLLIADILQGDEKNISSARNISCVFAKNKTFVLYTFLYII